MPGDGGKVYQKLPPEQFHLFSIPFNTEGTTTVRSLNFLLNSKINGSISNYRWLDISLSVELVPGSNARV